MTTTVITQLDDFNLQLEDIPLRAIPCFNLLQIACGCTCIFRSLACFLIAKAEFRDGRSL
jgi:hypothetical protein